MASIEIPASQLIGTLPVRAAQYVRMSTEHQQYSTVNQMDVLRSYANRHGIEIVHTYADDGRSGLRFDGRPALRQLIQDVVSGRADYTLILVYDVSRWGRFQDVDESAHYEFLCRQSGINIEYCAEQFANDGTPMGALLKGMKRIMAAEYSRELSVKVHFAQCRVARMGYVLGGPANLGFRRLVVDKHGTPRGTLERGDHKGVITDRILFTPGPPDEVALVRWIFRSCASGKSIGRIAATLNERGVPSPRGRLWINRTLVSMLRNEKYIGNSVWNKRSNTLQRKRVNNPQSDWIRVDGAFKPLVSRRLFDKAQKSLAALKEQIPDEVLLDKLKRLLIRKGRLSREIILADKRTPSPHLYDKRFGGLLEAYKKIGYRLDRQYVGAAELRHLRDICLRNAAETVERLRQAGRDATFRRTRRSIVTDANIGVHFLALRYSQKTDGRAHWDIPLRISPAIQIVAVARMKPGDEEILDYLLLPKEALRACSTRIHTDGSHPLEVYQCNTLDPLHALLLRNDLHEAPIGESILSAIVSVDATPVDRWVTNRRRLSS